MFLPAVFLTPQEELGNKTYKRFSCRNYKNKLNNRKKHVLTQNSELLRQPLLHDLVLAYVGHLALKHSTLVD